ncbi:hypothetical protein pipiens_017838, partial [Culex pipiens pipiens]
NLVAVVVTVPPR